MELEKIIIVGYEQFPTYRYEGDVVVKYSEMRMEKEAYDDFFDFLIGKPIPALSKTTGILFYFDIFKEWFDGWENRT